MIEKEVWILVLHKYMCHKFTVCQSAFEHQWAEYDTNSSLESVAQEFTPHFSFRTCTLIKNVTPSHLAPPPISPNAFFTKWWDTSSQFYAWFREYDTFSTGVHPLIVQFSSKLNFFNSKAKFSWKLDKINSKAKFS